MDANYTVKQVNLWLITTDFFLNIYIQATHFT